MKKQILMLFFASSAIYSQAQELDQNQVPSVILNNFIAQFPKATDVDWELDHGQYKVEFETGWSLEHDLWFDAEGNLVKHKEEIYEAELPVAVIEKIKTDFPEHSIHDLKRITKDQEVVYEMELKAKNKEDWELSIAANGTIIKKKED